MPEGEKYEVWATGPDFKRLVDTCPQPQDALALRDLCRRASERPGVVYEAVKVTVQREVFDG